MGLPLLSKHVVIHLDASRVNARLRRDLFSTTREGFREGPLLSEILEKVETILKADEKLNLSRSKGYNPIPPIPVLWHNRERVPSLPAGHKSGSGQYVRSFRREC
jgi:hypothetical protein